MEGRFRQRIQGKSENLYNYADALNKLYKMLAARCSSQTQELQGRLREYLIKGLRNPELKNYLLCWESVQPAASYEELVKKAVDWERDWRPEDVVSTPVKACSEIQDDKREKGWGVQCAEEIDSHAEPVK